MKLYAMFLEKDCTLLEINPIAEDTHGTGNSGLYCHSKFGKNKSGTALTFCLYWHAYADLEMPVLGISRFFVFV